MARTRMGLVLTLVALVAIGGAKAGAEEQAISNADVMKALQGLQSEVNALRSENQTIKAKNRELEAKVNGVQPVSVGSTMPMIAQPMPADPNAPVVIGDDNGSNGAGFYGYVEWLYLRARQPSHPYAGFITPVTGLGIDTDSFNITSIETRFDKDHAGRIGLGARTSCGLEIGFVYTHFTTDGNSAIGDPNGDSDNVHANLIDRNLATSAGLNGNLAQPGVVDAAFQSLNLDYDVVDLTLGRTFAYANDLDVTLFGGLRIAEIDQDSTIVYFAIEGAVDRDQAVILQNTGMQAWGLRGGSSARWALGDSGLSLVGQGAISLLHARFDGNRTDAYTNRSANDTEIRVYDSGTNSIVPVIELRAAVEFAFRNAFVGVGYEFTHWFNMQQHADVFDQTLIVNTTGIYRVDRGHLSLDGFFFNGGVRY